MTTAAPFTRHQWRAHARLDPIPREQVEYLAACPTCGLLVVWVGELLRVIEDELGGADIGDRTTTAPMCPWCPT